MITVTVSTPADAQALVAHVCAAQDRGLAIWGVTYVPGSARVTVRGFAPVVNDVIRAFQAAPVVALPGNDNTPEEWE